MTELDPAHVKEIQWCECLPGPYYGAQLAGTTPLCQRCRRIPNEPWMHAALLAALVRAGVLSEEPTIEVHEDGRPTYYVGFGSQATYHPRRRYVTRWEDVDA